MDDLRTAVLDMARREPWEDTWPPLDGDDSAAVARRASAIADACLSRRPEEVHTRDRRLDRVLTGWGGVYRQARAKMLSLREEEYVQSMRAFGLSDMVIAYKHMLPNAVGPVVVNLTLSTAMFILDEAAMSFLGLGVPPEIATWGNILNAAQDLYVMQNYWWLWLPVGIVVSLFVISVNCIGDGLRDSTDPTQQG